MADEPQVGQRHEDMESKRESLPHYYFPLKGLAMLLQETRGQVKTIVMEHFDGILFQNSGPANKQRTYQSIRHNSVLDWIVHKHGTCM